MTTQSMQLSPKTKDQESVIQRIPLTEMTKEEFWKKHQKPGIPVILTGILEGHSQWHLDYLCDQLGDRQFLLRQYGKDRYQQDKREWESIGSGVKTEHHSFSNYAQMLRNGYAQENDVYLAKCPITETPLSQEKSLKNVNEKLHNLGLTKPISHYNVWIGPGSHRECLHYDQMDGTLMQFYGQKKVILFPPTQTPNLYPFPFLMHLYQGLKLRCWFSQLYPETPDFQAFPNFRQAIAHQQEIILKPGELLYIPTGWWHEVVSLGDDMVCSINRFWRVYPTPRAILSWTRIRAYLGSICGVPYVIGSLILALLSKDRKQKVKAILHQL